MVQYNAISFFLFPHFPPVFQSASVLQPASSVSRSTRHKELYLHVRRLQLICDGVILYFEC